MQSISILMLGPQRCGKSSLLASMYKCFTKISQETDLSISVDPATSAILEDKFSVLRKIPEIRGIPSTSQIESYEFKLYHDEFDDEGFSIKFVDPPGGHLTQNVSKIKDLMVEASAILIPIDSIALMETNSDSEWSELNDERNKPDHIHNLIKGAYENNPGKRLIIFSPIFCEKYLVDQASQQELVDRFYSRYKKILKWLDNDIRKHNFAIVFAPVQTHGGVVFSHIGSPNDMTSPGTICNLEYYYKRKSQNATFSPKDVEQPLRYTMRFILSIALKAKEAEKAEEEKNSNFLDWIISAADRLWQEAVQAVSRVVVEIFDLPEDHPWVKIMTNLVAYIHDNKHIRDAIQIFSSGCKMNNPFKVIQGHELLTQSDN